MRAANSKIKTKAASVEKAQGIPKARKPSPKSTIASKKKTPISSSKIRQPVKKPTGKKTILINPLARSGDSWRSAPLTESSEKDLANKKTQKIQRSGPSTAAEGKKTAPKALINKVLLYQLSNTRVGTDYGSIEYFDSGSWKNVKIIIKNNELGVYDGANIFYPLSSFKVEKGSKAVKRFAEQALPEALIGGVLGLLAAGLMSFRPASIFGCLFGLEGDTKLSIKFDKKGIKAMEMAKIDVK